MYPNRRTCLVLLMLVGSASMLGCTSARPDAATAGGEGAIADQCFNRGNVESFSPLHGRFVYVRLIGGQQYLLTLDSLYTYLPTATGITISGAFSRVCSDTGAVLTFTGFGGTGSARIVGVESVESREAAQEIVDARTPR